MGFARIISLAGILGLCAACNDPLHTFERNPSDDPGGESLQYDAGALATARTDTVTQGVALTDGEIASVIAISTRAMLTSAQLAGARASFSPEVRAIAE